MCAVCFNYVHISHSTKFKWLQWISPLLWIVGVNTVYCRVENFHSVFTTVFRTTASGVCGFFKKIFIYSVQKYIKDKSMDVPQQQTTVNLQECIELFTTVETLEDENPW